MPGRLRHTMVLVMLLAANAFAGRGDKVGTASGLELLIPVGARSIALGGASIAFIDGIEALAWNPAGIVRSDYGSDVLVSHMSYLASIGVDYAAFGTSLGDAGRLGLSVKSISFGDIAVTTEDQPDGTGETVSPAFLVAGATISRRVSDKISAGITANVLYEKMGRVSASGIAFNAGVQYAGLGGIDGLGVGVALKNIGPPMKFGGEGLLRPANVDGGERGSSELVIDAAPADLPSTIEIGLGYKVVTGGRSTLDIMSSFQNNNFSDDEYHLGAEYGFENTFFARGGYAFSATESEYIYGASAGFGIRTALSGTHLAFDYAYRSAGYFGGNHVFAVGIEF